MTKRIPKLLQKILVGIVIAAVLLAVGLMAWQRRSQPKHAVPNGPSVAVVAPKDASRIIQEPLPQLVSGLMGQYVDQTSGSKCERIHEDNGNSHEQCYQLNTIIYLVDGDVTANMEQFITNANNNGWKMDGEALDAKQIMSVPAVNDDMTAKISAAAQSQMSFGMITPNFFGEQDFLKKDNLGAIVQAYSMDPSMDPTSDSDMLYVLRSEVPAFNNYDFQGKVLNALKADPSRAVIIISAGPAQ